MKRNIDGGDPSAKRGKEDGAVKVTGTAVPVFFGAGSPSKASPLVVATTTSTSSTVLPAANSSAVRTARNVVDRSDEKSAGKRLPASSGFWSGGFKNVLLLLVALVGVGLAGVASILREVSVPKFHKLARTGDLVAIKSYLKGGGNVNEADAVRCCVQEAAVLK